MPRIIPRGVVRRACALLGLSLQRHLMLGEKSFVSLRQRGLMPENSDE